MESRSQPLAPQPQRLGRRCCLALGRTLPAPAASAQALSTGQLFAHHCGVAPPALAQRGTLGHRAIYLALWPPFSPFSALCRLTSGKAALYTPTASCLHSPPCAVVGPQQPRRVRSRCICSLPAPLLGPLWAPLWKHHPASHLSCGSRFFGGSWQVAGSILSLASLILFMLVFTIWSGVPGQAAPPGVGRAVLFEPVRLDSTVPRPTEDTVMRDCLCPMLFYLLNLI